MFRRLVQVGLAGALTACSPQTPVLQAPIHQTGSPAPLVPSKEVPDEPLKQLALVGIEVVPLLVQDFARLTPVVNAYYDAYAKFPKATYRIQNFSGWEFRQGWFWSTENSEDLSVRARFETAAGTSPDWDVTHDGNYGPDFHPGIPTDMVRVRYEYDRKLPSGGRMAATLFMELPGDRQTPRSLQGSGSVLAQGTIGQVGFESLSASFGADGALVKGDVSLKSLYEGLTRQMSGQFGPAGWTGRARMTRSLHPIGEVGQVDGKWQFVNEGGSYPLQ